MHVISCPEFEEWYNNLLLGMKAQIDARAARIETFDHFGDVKNLGNGLAELRWKNGIRVYFAKTGNSSIILLLGGIKNAQKKDIKKARLLFQKYTTHPIE